MNAIIVAVGPVGNKLQSSWSIFLFFLVGSSCLLIISHMEICWWSGSHRSWTSSNLWSLSSFSDVVIYIELPQNVGVLPWREFLGIQLFNQKKSNLITLKYICSSNHMVQALWQWKIEFWRAIILCQFRANQNSTTIIKFLHWISK